MPWTKRTFLVVGMNRFAGDIRGRDCAFGGECLHPEQDNPPNREELEPGRQ
jgi:hypothetical protein